MNSWLTGEQLNEQWEKEMKKTSQEKKSSLETSEVSSVNEFVDAEEDNFPVQRVSLVCLPTYTYLSLFRPR